MAPPNPPPLPEAGFRPRAIILDVNGTLFDPEAARPAFQELGLDPASVGMWFAAVLRDAFAAQAAGGGSVGALVTFAEIGAQHLGDMLRAAGNST